MTRSTQQIRQALGASTTYPARTAPHGPFGVLQLQAELAERLRIRAGAGRPSDPAWTIRRLVGFRPDTWQTLAELADQASTPERRVSPGQVAAHLIEDGIQRIRAAAPPEDDAPPAAASAHRHAGS